MSCTPVRAVVAAVFAILAMAPNVMAQAESTAEVSLRQAVNVELVQGELERAIQLYQRIIGRHADNHVVAGRAQLYLGRTYEKLGNQLAAEAYRRVLTDFADQADLVHEARERLAYLTPSEEPTRMVTAEQVLVTSDELDLNNFLDMWPSPDGRTIAYTRVGSAGTLYLRDLASGDTTRLAEGYVWHPVWSRDGKRLAYQRFQRRTRRLEIIDVASRRLLSPGGVEHPDLAALAWSRDGESILCAWFEGEEARSLLLLSVPTGERRILIDSPALGPNVEADLSPDGRYAVFSGRLRGSEAIHVVDIASHETWELGRSVPGGRNPQWSPDGATVIYVNRDGTWTVPVTNGKATGPPSLLRGEPLGSPTWSADGALYYVAFEGNQAAYRIPVDPQSGDPRGAPERLPLDLDDGYTWFTWSPDMTRVAFATSRRAQMHVLNLASGASSSLPLNSEAPVTAMWWSTEGREIQFVTGGQQRTERRTILAVSDTGGPTRELFAPIPVIARSRFHVSPDGRQVVFYRRESEQGPRQLVIAPLGSADGRVLASGDDPEGGLTNWARPQFSPDGSRVLFGRHMFRSPNGELRLGNLRGDETWEFSLWVVSTTGSDLHRIAVAPQIFQAAWDPTGRMVTYSEWRGDPNDLSAGGREVIMVVDVASGEAHEIPVPGLSSASVRTWSSDGRWIGIIGGAGRAEFRVVRDFRVRP